MFRFLDNIVSLMTKNEVMPKHAKLNFVQEQKIKVQEEVSRKEDNFIFKIEEKKSFSLTSFIAKFYFDPENIGALAYCDKKRISKPEFQKLNPNIVMLIRAGYDSIQLLTAEDCIQGLICKDIEEYNILKMQGVEFFAVKLNGASYIVKVSKDGIMGLSLKINYR